MKLTKVASLLILALVITVAVSGCRKKPTYMTKLPGSRTGLPVEPGNGRPLDGDGLSNTNGIGSGPGGDHPQTDPSFWDTATRDREALKAQTVYFDFDSSVVSASEKGKVSAVAEHLKNNTKLGLQIEGNCDSRGTEEYNRSLGERRALAVREELIAMGIEPNRILTISNGEDKPAVQGDDNAAHAKNRRDEFVVLVPQ